MRLHDVEQRSPEWYALRLGIPTASEFSQLVTPTGRPSKSADTYARFLAAEKFVGRPLDMWSGNSWTDRGKEMEAHAVRLYEFERDVDVRKVGFVTSDDGAAGCSPDGMVGDDGMIEVKCLSAQNHIDAILHHRAHGTCPPDYVPQTQGQIMLCERAWGETVFYHPELPMLVVRQPPLPGIIAVLRAQIEAVITERDRVLGILQSIGGN